MDYTAGNSPQIVAVADFNRDNKLDIVAANLSDANVSVFLGKGDGTFQAAVNYASGDYPGVTVGDFNGDGKVDLVVNNFYANTISILLGNGSGSFSSPVTYATGTNPCTVVVADFNGDGKIDLAVSNYGSNTVSIFLGNGNGTFQPKVDYGTGVAPNGLAVGDYNGDGKLDLAVANWNSNDVSVLLGNGNGTFQTHVDYKAGSVCVDVVTADFNGDGELDLAVTNWGNNSGSTVTVLLGNGDGTFTTKKEFATGTGPATVVMGDFKKDGKVDLAVDNNGPNGLGSTVAFLAGNGDGTFQPYSSHPAGIDPAGLIGGDFNKDGKLDLVTTNYDNGNGSATAGHDISLSEATKNQGTMTAAASVTKFYWSTNSTYDASDVLLGQRSIPSLDAGATSGPASTNVTVPASTAAGPWYIIAVADSGKAVTEYSETNNTKYWKVTVVP